MKTIFFSLLVLQLQVFADAETNEDFVAHEWGTFTSVQGADGIPLEWNPLIVAELPKFVYDRNRPGGDSLRRAYGTYGGKSAFVALQRMETPVIYFYSGRQRTVDVQVNFPQGLITEWYPRAARFGPFPTTNQAELDLGRQSFLRWDNVEVMPRARNDALESLLPADKSGSHYFAARETGADFLRVNAGGRPNAEAEHEKFLFYRGIGSFQAPLQVTLGGNEDYLGLLNRGTEALTHLFVLSIDEGGGKFVCVERLPAGESKTVKLDPRKNQIPRAELRDQLGKQMSQSLAGEGLYAQEAAAMVQTWNDSWFGEPGLRVLYALPRAWTDRVLPLTLTPRPREVVRVMVGRAELITPTVEWQLLKQIVRFSEADPALQQQAVADTLKLGLGRFAEAAVRRVLGRTPSREFSQQAWNLLQASKADSNGQKSLAQK